MRRDMKTVIDDLLAVQQQYGRNKADTVLEALYESYCEGKGCDNAFISAQFGQLNEVLCVMPLCQQDRVIDLACKLCSAYQKEGYIDGVIAGFHLYRELSDDINWNLKCN